MKKRNIVLVGFMGTGKTAVGQALADALDYTYIDTDLMVEADAGMSIPKIFEKEGEPSFRKYETDAIKRIIHLNRYVIATGGGAVMSNENLENMKKAGPVICLTATPEVILERTSKESHRPLLKTYDPMKKIKTLLRIRAPQYAKADYTIDTSALSIKEVVQKIISIMEGES